MENVLITGTTSGIGKTFAEKFASMGNNIILVSRDRQKLEQQQLYLQNQYHVTVNYIAYTPHKRSLRMRTIPIYILDYKIFACYFQYIFINTLCMGTQF